MPAQAKVFTTTDLGTMLEAAKRIDTIRAVHESWLLSIIDRRFYTSIDSGTSSRYPVPNRS